LKDGEPRPKVEIIIWQDSLGKTHREGARRPTMKIKFGE
jgi:hypothetical protein